MSIKDEPGICCECGCETDNYDPDNDEYICPSCYAEILRQQEEDDRLDDPRHGQAS